MTILHQPQQGVAFGGGSSCVFALASVSVAESALVVVGADGGLAAALGGHWGHLAWQGSKGHSPGRWGTHWPKYISGIWKQCGHSIIGAPIGLRSSRMSPGIRLRRNARP